MTKRILYNLVFILLLSAYSVEVCPHVSGLGLLYTGISFVTITLPLFFLHLLILKRTRNNVHSFLLTFCYFLIIGILVGIYNFLYREFPVESAYKIIVGAIILSGLNAAIYSLEQPFIQKEKRLSFVNRISFFFIAVIVLLSVVWILMTIENINIFNSVEQGSMINLVESIVAESLFVLFVIAIYFLRIIHLYKTKLQIGLNQQISNLHKIRNDKLDVTIPRFSNDEFSIIGDEINNMIARLKEGEKIKTGFQKVTGKTISSEIIDRLTDNDFRSERKEMAVLFSDIKGFTALCEDTDPEIFVAKLNAHFEKIVRTVKAFGGSVNKFIGDAILVHFEGEGACQRALEASEKMVLDSNFDIGVGIHYGELLSGLLGSQDRLEFSIIGSVVNKSSRLESATRKLHANIVISNPVAERIKKTSLDGFKANTIQLKGFEQKEKIFYK